MHPAIRRLAVWAVTLSLVGWFWLPFGAGSDAVDADGICGPTLVLGHPVRHFEATGPSGSHGHCVFCHWRHTMAGASVSAMVAVVRPPDVSRPLSRHPLDGADIVVISGATPRGPPAVS